MAKSGKKEKPNVDKIVKKVNKEFEKTSAQVEALIDDAFKQFDSLQTQVQEPIRKLLKEIDELREREIKRFHDEFDRRMGEFHNLQSSLLDRLGIAQKEAKRGQQAVDESLKSASKTAEKTAKTAEKKAGKAASKTSKTAGKGASKAKAAASSAKSKASTTASTTKAVAKQAKGTVKAAAKGNDLSDLTRIKGIGPVTAKKLNGAGITSINQVANPTEADKEAIGKFANMRGFEAWQTEARKLVE